MIRSRVRALSPRRLIRSYRNFIDMQRICGNIVLETDNCVPCLTPLKYLPEEYLNLLSEDNRAGLNRMDGIIEEIKWRQDPISSARFFLVPSVLSDVIPFKGNDPRTVWDRSRFQRRRDAVIVGNSRDVALSWMNEVASWIDANPPGLGINWVSPMEAAIRSVNWIMTLSYCIDLVSGEKWFIEMLTKSLLIHSEFLYKNREIKLSGLTTNHTTAVYAGILCISLAFPDYHRSPEWREQAIDGIETCLKEQIRPDGTDFESSTGYHRLVLDIAAHSLAAAEYSGIEVKQEIKEILRNMYDVHSWMVNSTGYLPQIGDNDNGMWLSPICDQTTRIQFYLVRKVAGDLKDITSDNDTFHVFEDGGFIHSRLTPSECLLAAFPIGQSGLGGHNHEDLLQLCISVNGVPFIVDGGTGSYNRSLQDRMHFRSRGAHSIPYFEDSPGYYQYRTDGPFDLESYPEIGRELSAVRTEGGHILSGSVELKGQRIERKVMNFGSSIQIIDNFETSLDYHRPVTQFIIHPQWEVSLEGNSVRATRGNTVITLSSSNASIELLKIRWSPSYDVIVTAPSVKFRSVVASSGSTIVSFLSLAMNGRVVLSDN